MKENNDNKQFIPLGPNVVIKVNTTDLDKVGSIYIAKNPSINLDQAREEVEIVSLGEDAFSDLSEENRPKIGDIVIIPRYEGRVLGKSIEDTYLSNKADFELRVVLDTRIMCIVKYLENNLEDSK